MIRRWSSITSSDLVLVGGHSEVDATFALLERTDGEADVSEADAEP